MTTIAYRDGVMACDSQITENNGYFANTQKIYHIKAGNGSTFLVGLAGSIETFTPFLKFIKEGGEKPTFRESAEFDALVVSESGLVLSYTKDCNPCSVTGDFISIGSGAQYANGAMAHGASPFEAVGIAARFDVYTGGEVKQYEVDDIQKNVDKP